MKKIISLVLLSFVLLMSGCSSSNSKYLDRPENTNLTYWITQKTDDIDFKDCTYLPDWFGASAYLDSKYEPVNTGGMDIAPEIHVIYLVTGYPDLKDSNAITTIDITDPEIYVYGLSLKSTSDEIERVMIENKFKKSIDEDTDKTYYRKNNTVFCYSLNSINIQASTTNKTHITY